MELISPDVFAARNQLPDNVRILQKFDITNFSGAMVRILNRQGFYASCCPRQVDEKGRE